jgi:hypothetical protein
VDETHRPVADLGGVEEGVLLLVAEHLDRRLADHAEVSGLSLGGGVREHDLMSEGRLARPWAPADEVEGILGDPAAEYVIEARYPGVQFADGNAIAHFLFSEGASSSRVGQALRRA